MPVVLLLCISSQVHAQSHAEVLEKGKIIQQIDKKEYRLTNYVVVYKNWAYTCMASYARVLCAKIYV